MRFTGFEWDDGNWPKCGKHGVTREEIEQFFVSAKVAPDLKHSVLVLCITKKYYAMKKVPTLKTDQEAEAFLDQDLSNLDFSQFKPMRFEFAPKSAALQLRLPEALLQGVKDRAQAKGVPYTRYVRMLLENDLAKLP